MKTALYYIRTRCNYSQAMVAQELEVSRQILSAWETGAKPLPQERKSQLARLFGVEEAVLDEKDEGALVQYCDRAVFSHEKAGRQVFSFQPPERQIRVFLEGPKEERPEERCKELMCRKNQLLEDIDHHLRFTEGRQAEELHDMSASIAALEGFARLIHVVGETGSGYQGRVIQFVQEQLEILAGVLEGTDLEDPADPWKRQQRQLLRARWGQQNRQTQRKRQGKAMTPAMRPMDRESLLRQIDALYQDLRYDSWNRAELQWKLNQLLNRENGYETD